MAAVQPSLTDELALACQTGADLEDLLQIMRDRGHIEANDDGVCEAVLIDEQTEEETRGPLRSIMLRAGGVLAKGKLIAEWLLKLRAEQIEKEDTANEHADALIQSAMDWRNREVEKARKKVAWIDGLLEWFLRDVGVQKMPLVNGTLALKTNQPHKAWDEKAALAWALSLPDPDAGTKRVLDKTKINGLIEERGGGFYDTSTGEKIDFVTMEPPATPDTFGVR